MELLYRIINKETNIIVANNVSAYSLRYIDIKKDTHIIDQYVGLFDDNGKRIYSSDIVEVIDGKMKHTSKIYASPTGVYIDNHPTWKELTNNTHVHLENYSDYGCGRGITQRCYVIGNIYESPNLILNGATV